MSAISLTKGIDREALRLAVEKHICEENLHAFIKRAWKIVEPGAKFIDNWHLEYICDHLMAITDGHEMEGGKPYNRLLINVPPGMMKSLIVNVFLARVGVGAVQHAALALYLRGASTGPRHPRQHQDAAARAF